MDVRWAVRKTLEFKARRTVVPWDGHLAPRVLSSNILHVLLLDGGDSLWHIVVSYAPLINISEDKICFLIRQYLMVRILSKDEIWLFSSIVVFFIILCTWFVGKNKMASDRVINDNWFYYTEKYSSQWLFAL